MYIDNVSSRDLSVVDADMINLEGNLRRQNAPQTMIDDIYRQPASVRLIFLFCHQVCF